MTCPETYDYTDGLLLVRCDLEEDHEGPHSHTERGRLGTHTIRWGGKKEEKRADDE